MTINETEGGWFGTEPDDVRAFLEHDQQSYGGHGIDEFRVARCSCGCVDFRLEYDGDTEAAIRVCLACEAVHAICDGGDHWDDAEPEEWECDECGSTSVNLGVGFSINRDKGFIRWLYVGQRCVACGLLASCINWKVAYTPSMHLLDQV
ncbi:MAG: hypothetical protein K2R98_14240 [Gemmataceae bacterium]|nr:hypothetical protein [Gemmataceae bacterium]